MSKLQPIQIDEHTVIYIEAEEGIDTSGISAGNGYNNGYENGNGYGAVEGEQSRTSKGIVTRSPQTDVMTARVQTLENTIRYYTTYMLNGFKKIAIAEVKKVTLEFGVNMSGVSGIPYIASGTAGCNVRVQVECSFDNQDKPKPQ
ncbi:CU044_2847 family protein [Leptolyngbya sp. AN02str]|uniref:CU044_2847 family protein n=1 Tax=Leptolyngbya sp. AN02str TaxID=3423363 RepID=UPI003D322FD6